MGKAYEQFIFGSFIITVFNRCNCAGFFKKLNVGVVAIGLAMILGKIAGVGDIFCIWLFLRGIN